MWETITLVCKLSKWWYLSRNLRVLTRKALRMWSCLAKHVWGLCSGYVHNVFGILRESSGIFVNGRVISGNLINLRIKISRLWPRKSWQVYAWWIPGLSLRAVTGIIPVTAEFSQCYRWRCQLVVCCYYNTVIIIIIIIIIIIMHLSLAFSGVNPGDTPGQPPGTRSEWRSFETNIVPQGREVVLFLKWMHQTPGMHPQDLFDIG